MCGESSDSRTDYQQFWAGVGIGIIGVICVGAVAAMNGPSWTPYAFGALATGLYFVGFNQLIGSVYKKDPNYQKLINKIDALQKRLDEKP